GSVPSETISSFSQEAKSNPPSTASHILIFFMDMMSLNLVCSYLTFHPIHNCIFLRILSPKSSTPITNLKKQKVCPVLFRLSNIGKEAFETEFISITQRGNPLKKVVTPISVH